MRLLTKLSHRSFREEKAKSKAKWTKTIETPNSMFNHRMKTTELQMVTLWKEPFPNLMCVNTLTSGKWIGLSNLTALKVHLATSSTIAFPNSHKINITKH